MPPVYRDMPPVSKGEINRHGAYLAELHRLRGSGDYKAYWSHYRAGDVRRATEIVDAFRAAHQKPLSIASVGLRQFVGTALGVQPVVSQRLKRLPRIIRKLSNMERSNLARLEDIGGTRAIVASIADQETLCKHIEMRWGDNIKRQRDYVADPKDTGYRARHFVLEKTDRRVEIQVRTEGQQRWANAIEQMDSRNNLALKDGVGPQELLDYFSTAGAMIYHQETNTPPPSEVSDAYSAAVDAAIDARWFVRRKRN